MNVAGSSDRRQPATTNESNDNNDRGRHKCQTHAQHFVSIEVGARGINGNVCGMSGSFWVAMDERTERASVDAKRVRLSDLFVVVLVAIRLFGLADYSCSLSLRLSFAQCATDAHMHTRPPFHTGCR